MARSKAAKATIPTVRIETRPLVDLRPAVWNPRRISPEAMTGLRASVERFGLVQPIILNERTGNVVGGHQRLKVLEEAGQVAAQVVILNISESEEKALNVALNNPHISGEFDDGLDALLAQIREEEAELYEALRLGELETPEPEQVEPQEGEDDAPEVQATPVTVRGDLWLLGGHRIICGDCRDFADVERLVDGRKVNVAFTSPPYASQRKYDESSGFKPIPPDEYVDWFEDVQGNVRAVLADDGSWFVNIKEHCEDGQRHLYVKDLTIAHVRWWAWRFVDELVWAHGGTPGEVHRRFKNGWEPVLQFTSAHDFKFHPERVRHESDAARGKYADKKRDRIGAAESQGRTGDIFANPEIGHGLAFPSNVLRLGKNREALGHGAAFPVDLPQFFILAFSDAGDVVFDPFMGSGTTLIAAEKTGRAALGTEISPNYCDVIVRRWQTFTGKAATLDGDGRTFDDVAGERLGGEAA